MTDARPRTWLVTGAGRGIGRAVTVAALAAGDQVAATVRRPEALDDLAERHGDALEVLVLDVRDHDAVERTVAAAVARFGGIDVAVNNAGYGLVGAIEEIAPEEAEAIVATNLFGAVWVSRAVVPLMREQGSGHIVQISTIGGVGSMPTFGLYNASKWALEGFSEALAAEVAPFGVRVTIAELGGFDTDWGGASMQFAQPLPVYDDLRRGLFGTDVVPWPPVEAGAEGAATGQADTDDRAGTDDEAGAIDAPPRVAAEAILAHVDADHGPLRLLVGADAPTYVAMALEARRDDYASDPRFTWPAPPDR